MALSGAAARGGPASRAAARGGPASSLGSAGAVGSSTERYTSRLARSCPAAPPAARVKELFLDNLLVRIHLTIVMIRWTGLAPWVCEFPFPGSLISTFLVLIFSSAVRGGAVVRLQAALSAQIPTLRESRLSIYLVEGAAALDASIPHSLTPSLPPPSPPRSSGRSCRTTTSCRTRRRRSSAFAAPPSAAATSTRRL